MSTDQKAVATARRIYNFQHSKALAMAPIAEQVCRVSNSPAKHLMALPDDAWLQMAQAVGKAGPKGDDVPSPTTRGMVVDAVERALSQS